MEAPLHLTAIALASLVALTSLACSTWARAPSLPVVDLGYELHQASSFNSTGSYYAFKVCLSPKYFLVHLSEWDRATQNIRFAEPPVGELRFAAPVSPHTNRSQIEDGSVGASCFQAIPDWGTIASQFVPTYLEGKPVNVSKFNTSAPNWFQVGDTPMSEDCPFLDVYVPERTFQSASPAHRAGSGAPVLVWMFGGGYVFGSKEYWGDPATLIETSLSASSEGVIRGRGRSCTLQSSNTPISGDSTVAKPLRARAGHARIPRIP